MAHDVTMPTLAEIMAALDRKRGGVSIGDVRILEPEVSIGEVRDIKHDPVLTIGDVEIQEPIQLDPVNLPVDDEIEGLDASLAKLLENPELARMLLGGLGG